MTGFAPPAHNRQDGDYMAAALAFGRWGLGRTAENPSVGALVVRDGVIVGQGVTQDGGRPHAEPQALAQAGDFSRGATLYVTLEPCSHHGKTAPCVQAIVNAGVARVVSAMDDPDPRVSGRGHEFLRSHGVEVLVGVREPEARRDHMGHILRVRENRPMVTLKLAQTRDGFAAGDARDPRLHITSALADARTHVFRAMHDAIMVGPKTAVIDDPLLTVRGMGLGHRKPLRVVLDAKLAMSPGSRLAAGAKETPTLVITGSHSPDKIAPLRDAGVKIAWCPTDELGRLVLSDALHLLHREHISRVFSEGGPTIAAALIEQDLADEVIVMTGALPLGREGHPALSHRTREILADGARYRIVEETRIGLDDIRIYLRTI